MLHADAVAMNRFSTRSKLAALGFSAALLAGACSNSSSSDQTGGPDGAAVDVTSPPADGTADVLTGDDGASDAGSNGDTGSPDSSMDAPADACTADPCVTELAAGYQYECALLSDGTVRCWGSNAQGALGRATDAAVNPVPEPVAGLSSVVQIAAGFYHACALRSDNTVLCWGSNTNGQLGPDGPDGAALQLTAVAVPGIPGTVGSIHMGGYFSCAHLIDKRVYCWGDSEWGNMGGGTLLDSGTFVPASQPTPVEVTAVGTPEELNAGDRYNCVRTSSGTIECLGENVFGQLGRGDAGLTLNANTTAPVVGISGATRLFESEAYHACALASGGVQCWGYNTNGQVGADPLEAGTAVQTPHTVTNLGSIVDLSPGGISTCALTSAGTVKCWGSNVFGEMAKAPDAGTTFPSPVDIPGVAGVTQIAAGHETICALLTGGSVVCWGDDTNGSLGRSSADGAAPPPTYVPAAVAF